MLRKSLRLSLIFVLPVIAALVLTSFALAHGSTLTPLTRAFLCYIENAESPDTLPCQDVVNMGGTQPIYDWNEVNQRAGGSVENSMAIIPDGHLCGAGREKYYGFDQARADWPVTILPAGGSPYTFQVAVTANHPTASFHFYVTKAGYNPNVPLKWSDIEKFAQFENPSLDAVAGLQYPVYQFPTTLPSRSGRHLIYIIWERHDSIEDFYMCSDVWFGTSPTPSPTAAPACSAPEWVSGSAYNAGAIVSHNNKQWISKWTNSDEPNTLNSAAPWKIQANCTYSGASGAPLPTATFMVVPTSTAGPSPTACTNCGPTNTPVPPTATFTSAPPINTATRTNTAGPTATRTRTPTTGPSATRTNTPVAGFTATRTNTPAVVPSNTPTTVVAPSNTPTTGGACSPVTSTITVPFTFDGAGTFCWQASTLGAYLNSWNTTSVAINGVNITNLYMASGSYPAKINGFWYISYNSTVAWAHFEAK